MRRTSTILSLFLFMSIAHGREKMNWSYHDLTTDSDLIVIATPVSVKDNVATTTFPDVQQLGADNVSHPVPAIGIETAFRVLAILKGEGGVKQFILYHLREVTSSDLEVNGPGTVAFIPEEKKCYLMFLKREADGRYESITGQTDPIDGIKDLGTRSHDHE